MKFSIRDLFLVTMIVALVVGWWVHAERMQAELDQAYEAQLQGEARAVTAEHKVKVAKAIIDRLNASAQAPDPNPPKP